MPSEADPRRSNPRYPQQEMPHRDVPVCTRMSGMYTVAMPERNASAPRNPEDMLRSRAGEA